MLDFNVLGSDQPANTKGVNALLDAVNGGRDHANGRIEGLLRFVNTRHAERNATIVIGFRGCCEIKLGKRDFFGALRSELPQRLSDNRVILNFFPVLIAED